MAAPRSKKTSSRSKPAPKAKKAAKAVAKKPAAKAVAKKPAAKKPAVKKTAPVKKVASRKPAKKAAVARSGKAAAKTPPTRAVPPKAAPAKASPKPQAKERIERTQTADLSDLQRRSGLELIEGGQSEAVTPTPETGDASGTRGKYVYCVVRSEEPLRFGKIGLGAEPSEVNTVNYKDLAAVVSDVPMGVLDPTRENVLAHQQVTERVMRDFTVLPMSFGTVFKTDEDIVELLKSAYDAFGDVLQKMQDKFEFGLKVLWDRDQVIKQLEDENEDLRRLKGEIAGQKGSTYFARMQYGRMVDAALQERSERYVSEIFEMLRDVAVASRSNKPIGDKMIMNAAFLVSRDKEAAFDARVKKIGEEFDSLTFKYTGPWPAYNFVNIRLKLERAAP